MALGIVGGLLAYRMIRTPIPGAPHTACAAAVTASASESGAHGAFGKKIKQGTLAAKRSFSSPEYGKLVQEQMSRTEPKAPE